MSEEEIEALAFKNRSELKYLNDNDLLDIIEFLQLDRKEWINQYSNRLNNSIDLIAYEKLKQKLNCKEVLKSSLPENTEFVILTKANYERQEKDLEIENIKLKQQLEEEKNIRNKAIEYCKENISCYFDEDLGYVEIDKISAKKILQILQNKEKRIV